MKWGLTKEINQKQVKREDYIFIQIRYFWKKIHKLFGSDGMLNKLQEYLKDENNLNKFKYEFDTANDKIREIIIGSEKQEKIHQILEKLYQFLLGVYNTIRTQK
jgi:hypothetical protein